MLVDSQCSAQVEVVLTKKQIKFMYLPLYLSIFSLFMIFKAKIMLKTWVKEIQRRSKVSLSDRKNRLIIIQAQNGFSRCCIYILNNVKKANINSQLLIKMLYISLQMLLSFVETIKLCLIVLHLIYLFSYGQQTLDFFFL